MLFKDKSCHCTIPSRKQQSISSCFKSQKRRQGAHHPLSVAHDKRTILHAKGDAVYRGLLPVQFRHIVSPQAQEVVLEMICQPDSCPVGFQSLNTSQPIFQYRCEESEEWKREGSRCRRDKKERDQGKKVEKRENKRPLDGAGVSNKLIYPGMPSVHKTSVREHAEGLLAFLHAFLPACHTFDTHTM